MIFGLMETAISQYRSGRDKPLDPRHFVDKFIDFRLLHNINQIINGPHYLVSNGTIGRYWMALDGIGWYLIYLKFFLITFIGIFGCLTALLVHLMVLFG